MTRTRNSDSVEIAAADLTSFKALYGEVFGWMLREERFHFLDPSGNVLAVWTNRRDPGDE